VNVFDVILILLLALFTGIGVWRGLVRELVSFVTWVVAGIGAWMFAGRLASAFESLTRESELQQMLAFAVIFVAVFVIGTAIGLVLHKLVNRSAALRSVNRVTGGALGLVRGSAIVVIFFLLAGLTSFPQRPWWREAALAPAFERAAAFASHYLPPDVARHVRYG
jgi:membrane protein required for colicin V production